MSDSTGLIAQVVPDLPTFAVDDGFAYSVPDGLPVVIGSIVRIPLGSRRIRGYVVSMRTGDTARLKPVISVSGDEAVFTESLLRVLRWAAVHYVAPMSVLLGRAAPPNLPRGKTEQFTTEVPPVPSPLPQVSNTAAAGRHIRPTALIAGRDYGDLVAGLASEPLRADRNVAVVAPTVDEAIGLVEQLRPVYGDRVLEVSSSLPAKVATRQWLRAQRTRGALIVGTPEIALWPLGQPALWLIVEEGRRAMKAKQTPTLQVREVVRRRSLIERSAIVFIGAVPTVDVLAKGAATKELPGRAWPLVELVDRREDPGRTRSMGTRTLTAIRSTVRAGGQVFVFVSRRGYAPAFRCVRCRELRRCGACGSGPDRRDTCRRCRAELGPCAHCDGRRFEALGAGIGRVTEELARDIGAAHVGPIGSGRQLIVGSERDLPYVPDAALSVAVDADSMLMAPNYRAAEDTFRLLSRVALRVARGGGRRCLVQTAQPAHPLLAALQSGHPLDYLRQLGEERERDQLPPAAELLAIEIAGDAEAAEAAPVSLAGSGVQIHGPEAGGGRVRWFLQGRSLEEARVLLRPLVQGWRDAGLKVRIDADPIDL